MGKSRNTGLHAVSIWHVVRCSQISVVEFHVCKLVKWFPWVGSCQSTWSPGLCLVTDEAPASVGSPSQIPFLPFRCNQSGKETYPPSCVLSLFLWCPCHQSLHNLCPVCPTLRRQWMKSKSQQRMCGLELSQGASGVILCSVVHLLKKTTQTSPLSASLLKYLSFVFCFFFF